MMIRSKQELLSNKHTGFEQVVNSINILSLPRLADFFFAFLSPLYGRISKEKIAKEVVSNIKKDKATKNSKHITKITKSCLLTKILSGLRVYLE